jgi:hypothetical protein
MKQMLGKKNHSNPWKQEWETGKRNTKRQGPEAANQSQQYTGKQYRIYLVRVINDEKQR